MNAGAGRGARVAEWGLPTRPVSRAEAAIRLRLPALCSTDSGPRRYRPCRKALSTAMEA